MMLKGITQIVARRKNETEDINDMKPLAMDVFVFDPVVHTLISPCIPLPVLL